MIRAPSISLNILLDYCKDTHFDTQQTAKLFLESCLIQWEPYTPDEKEEKIFGNYIKVCFILSNQPLTLFVYVYYRLDSQNN